MSRSIEEALQIARTPEAQFCATCGEKLYAPLDKLSIALYGQCPIHFEDGSHQHNNLLTLIESL